MYGHIRCIYVYFGRDLMKYMVIHGLWCMYTILANRMIYDAAHI